MQNTKETHDITLPRLSDTDEESLITFWHKSEGDIVKKGDVLVEVQTEKAVSEIESDRSGVVVKIHKKRGEVIAVGEILISIADEVGAMEPIPPQSLRENTATDDYQESSVKSCFVRVSPRVRKLAKDLGVDLATIKGTGKNGEPTIEDVQKAASDNVELEKMDEKVQVSKPVSEQAEVVPESETEESDVVTQRIIAPPTVRKLAREKGVDLEELQAIVKRKILKEDVLWFVEERERKNGEDQVHILAGTTNPVLEVLDTASDEVEVIRLAGIRKVIAKRMTYSKKTIPHVTHFAEAGVSDLVKHRDRLKEVAIAKNIKLTFLPYIIKAMISALKEYKELNASIDETEENIIYKKFYHIGIAVQTSNGLIVPVIKNADKKKISELAKEIDVLTVTAKESKLTTEQIRGGTFTISNIGSVGGQWFTPVINHPETAILGIGEIFDKPIVKNGEITIGKVLPLSLSYDHRVIDGVIAQNALNHIKKLLQDPELLLLDLD
ncbi:2-oxo acid dehydrogenase subunit E2 [Bacillaceae bacterium CLA-AA-H227]|uniref:2-oxo acid dehydrogenase subunit E2 n=1 Tax=Robertmurraya yapensis (ex Hitch et al 2024) TaxID=3133160 RepID=A0ACC6SBJ2_9BACI